nr:hypothetical protein [Candidatus Woesearchaeota archaeon]
MFNLFEVKDKSNRIIYLTKERWKHIIIRHPEIINNIESLKEALINPTIIRIYNFDNNIANYYKYFKDRKKDKRYLLVIVKYLNGKGFIITSYFIGYIK